MKSERERERESFIRNNLHGDGTKGVIQNFEIKGTTYESLRVGLSYASKIITKLVLVAQTLTLECHTENGPLSARYSRAESQQSLTQQQRRVRP